MCIEVRTAVSKLRMFAEKNAKAGTVCKREDKLELDAIIDSIDMEFDRQERRYEEHLTEAHDATSKAHRMRFKVEAELKELKDMLRKLAGKSEQEERRELTVEKLREAQANFQDSEARFQRNLFFEAINEQLMVDMGAYGKVIMRMDLNRENNSLAEAKARNEAWRAKYRRDVETLSTDKISTVQRIRAEKERERQALVKGSNMREVTHAEHLKRGVALR